MPQHRPTSDVLSGWCHEHYRFKKENKKGDLKHLVDFIMQAAEEATDPVFSRLSDAKPKEASNKAKKKKKKE